MRLLAFLLLPIALSAQTVFTGGAAIDQVVEQAIRTNLTPGAVVIVGHEGRIVFRKAYGRRAIVPKPEPETLDTIFDVASLTKVIATTPSIMKLFEEGKIRINDPVTNYLPEFQGGHSNIRVRDLLTHFSGLRPDLDLKPAWTGYDTAVQKALAEKSVAPPGVRFVYSDINFILLGEIGHRLSGKMLSDYARENVFQPIGMTETRFLPPAELLPRIAPTEVDPATGLPFRGVVHDPTARFMGGVAGDAGLYTTADDLAKFAQMMLDGGVANGVRVFSPATIEKFTTPQSPADQPILRGLGWDIDSPYSSNRGELFPIGSYGHTGYTGTSLWIDPFSKSYVIVLTNYVHPQHGNKSLNSLRSRIATIAAASFGYTSPHVKLTGYNETIIGPGLHRLADHQSRVMTGLDVLAKQNFAPLQGKRIGLITNQSGRGADGKRNIDLMLAAGVKITALFSPEHGIAGTEDQPNVSDSRDEASGLPVFSLYTANARRISPERLRGLDALVFDIQDAGARFYTYSCTMIYAMEDAAKNRIPFYVLDRPNPITGVHVEGPILDKDLESFVGCFEMPVRHGLTLGELARMVNEERHLGADLTVVPMEGWDRGDWFDSTGLTWINPSPNLRSLNAAALYPGVALLESSKNYSVGRGTDSPFEQIGADWIDGRELADFLNGRFIPGVRFYPTRFRPETSVFAGKTIPGVRLVVTDRDSLDSTRLGLEIGYAIQKLYPGKLVWNDDRLLIGNREVLHEAETGTDPRTIVQEMQDTLAAWIAKRDKYLLYR